MRSRSNHAACGAQRHETPDPSAVFVPLPVAPSVAYRDIMVGERIEGVFGNGSQVSPAEHHFVVTASTNGPLEVTLQWDPSLLGTLLTLRSQGLFFRPDQPDGSLIGRISVRADGRYPIAVALARADRPPHDPYVLTTRLEP